VPFVADEERRFFLHFLFCFAHQELRFCGAFQTNFKVGLFAECFAETGAVEAADMEVSLVSELLAEEAFPAFVVVLVQKFLHSEVPGLVCLFEVPVTDAEHALFRSALHIVHCQVCHLV
jgi:hypothetical protein